MKKNVKEVLITIMAMFILGILIGNLLGNNGECLAEKMPIAIEDRGEAYKRCSRKRDEVCGEGNSFGYSAWFDYDSDKTIRKCDILCIYGEDGECTEEAKKYNFCD